MSYCSSPTIRGLLCLFVFALFNNTLSAQQPVIYEYVMFAGSGGPGTTPPAANGYSVQIGSSINISGGAIGSYKLVQTTGTTTINSKIHSGGRVLITNSNVVTGRITANNSDSLSGPILSAGSGVTLSGNIDVNGDILVGGGTVSGIVTHPFGTTYTGPVPGAEVIGTPNLVEMPALPAITTFPAAGSTNFTTTADIFPGAYNNITLSGNKTITLKGPGIYIFDTISLTGNSNKLIFDFQNNTSGNYYLYIHGDADFGKLNASISNGGSPSRIYTEIHGSGMATSIPTYSFIIANGSSGGGSKWLGTVWAPYAGINIGSGTGSSNLTGALYSGTQVHVQSGVTFSHASFDACATPPNANAGVDKELTCQITSIQLSGSSTTPGALFSWAALDSSSIISGANTATPTVGSPGYYLLTVTDPATGCTARDTALVTFDPCILPYYPPLMGSKSNTPIGSELTSLYLNFNTSSDTLDFIYLIQSDSVFIDVIALVGKYDSLLALLQSAEYGMTDFIDNGPNTLIISGKFKIANLLKLNFLPTLIDYVRPLFPAISSSGVANSAGDTAIHTDFIRNGFQVYGDSIKVGVLSDSYNTIPGNPAQTNVANGDLPGNGNPNNPVPVHVLQDFPYGQRSDEGRAMLQIVHDVAPQAKLAFQTGFISPGHMAQGINALVLDTCDVITDDITYITEPFFQDGVVSRAVDSAAAKGVSYFTAAGNYGRSAHMGIFNPATPPYSIAGEAHDYGGGDLFQHISLLPGNYLLVMQWEDSIYSMGQTTTGTQNDLDIYLTYDNGKTLFGFNRNNILGDPLEVLPFTVTDTAETNIMVVRASGSSPLVSFKYVIFRGDITFMEFETGTSTIVGQANANGAMTLGAVRYTRTPEYGVNPPLLETFSSTGGTPVYGTVRNKPDFTAPDGVNTTVNFNSLNIEGDA
ncbi:MAG TPA: hypothetical protein VFO70_06050, partial [Chitinophagaceae bacterium]|nr:hypothetical protein [Chitinophagaceae bacterium]